MPKTPFRHVVFFVFILIHMFWGRPTSVATIYLSAAFGLFAIGERISISSGGKILDVTIPSNLKGSLIPSK